MNLSDCGDIVTREEVMAIFRIPSWNALYRRLQKGRFPQPVMARPVRWAKRDLERWLNGDQRPGQLRRAI